MPYCRKCGEEVKEKTNFCPKCGNKLDSEKDSSKDDLESSDEQKKSTVHEEKEEKEDEEKQDNQDEDIQETAKKLREEGVIGDKEKVIAYSKQSRISSVINPASLIVTEKHLVHYQPEIIGSTIKTRKIDEIIDISIDSGLKKATITIRAKAMDDLEFEDFPKDEAKEIRKAVIQSA